MRSTCILTVFRPISVSGLRHSVTKLLQGTCGAYVSGHGAYYPYASVLTSTYVQVRILRTEFSFEYKYMHKGRMYGELE